MDAIATFDQMILEETATWWEMLLPSGKVYFGEAKSKMLGYEESDFDVYQDFVDLLHKEDAPKAMQAMRDHMEGKKEYYETIYRIKTKTGEYVKFFDIGKIISRDGDQMKVTGLVFKIANDTEAESIKNFAVNGDKDLIEFIGLAKS